MADGDEQHTKVTRRGMLDEIARRNEGLTEGDRQAGAVRAAQVRIQGAVWKRDQRNQVMLYARSGDAVDGNDLWLAGYSGDVTVHNSGGIAIRVLPGSQDERLMQDLLGGHYPQGQTGSRGR